LHSFGGVSNRSGLQGNHPSFLRRRSDRLGLWRIFERSVS
jgi:hypothetical protein